MHHHCLHHSKVPLAAVINPCLWVPCGPVPNLGNHCAVRTMHSAFTIMFVPMQCSPTGGPSQQAPGHTHSYTHMHLPVC